MCHTAYSYNTPYRIQRIFYRFERVFYRIGCPKRLYDTSLMLSKAEALQYMDFARTPRTSKCTSAYRALH